MEQTHSLLGKRGDCMNISTWAMKNGLLQCMGCKGYGPSHHITWHRTSYGATLPYCTEECKQNDD